MKPPPDNGTEAFSFDPSYIDVMYGEISEMGMVEMTRKRAEKLFPDVNESFTISSTTISI